MNFPKQTTLFNSKFFKGARGRPKKGDEKDDSGDEKDDSDVVEIIEFDDLDSKPKAKIQKVTTPKAKKQRTNWGSPENESKLQQAVDDWDKKKGKCLDSNGEIIISLTAYCNVVNIPYSTFQKYVTKKGDRRIVGAQVGRKPLLDQKDQRFIAEVCARKDRANDGAQMSSVVSYICDLKPGVSEKAGRDHFHRTLKKKNSDILKTNLVATQGTSTKRNAITTAQQFRWHTLVDDCLARLREHNKGLCKCGCGKSFGELIDFFVVAADETCLMAGERRMIRIVGAKDKKKHMTLNDDSRESITMLRTGDAAGNTGPTGFLLKGKTRRRNYSDTFLVKNGARKGSTLLCNDSAFMTTVTWDEFTPKIVAGYRCINKHVEANKDWLVLEVIDGFGPHYGSIISLKVRKNNNILTLKEEGETSHVCQAYDKFVAKLDKVKLREAISALKGLSIVYKGVVDQYGLVQAGLYAIRATTPKVWIRSFESVNLRPSKRKPFPEWCVMIKEALEAGSDFQVEKFKLDPYESLPLWWRRMPPVQKKVAFNIVETYDGEFTVDCIKKLHEQIYIPVSDIQTFRVCYLLAKEQRHHLEQRENITVADSSVTEEERIGNTIISGNKKRINRGLNFFNLVPENLRGLDLFEHQVKYRELRSRENTSKPSAYLDVEVTKENVNVLNHTRTIMCGKNLPSKREIFADSYGTGATKKLARRKIDSMGRFKAHSAIVNDTKAMERFENFIRMSASIAEISKHEDDSKKEKIELLVSEYREIYKTAIEKLTKFQNATKITKKEICAVLHVRCNTFLDWNKIQYTKPKLVDELIEKIKADPNLFGGNIGKNILAAAAAAEHEKKKADTQDDALVPVPAKAENDENALKSIQNQEPSTQSVNI